MRNSLKAITLFAVAFVAPCVRASSVTWNATVDCSLTCVTVSLEWVNEPFPVGWAEVDDALGDFLFALNVPQPGSTTGSILPDPQTISGLSPTEIFDVTDGMAGVDPPAIPAEFVLKECQTCSVITSVAFVASLPATVPEPTTWASMSAGLAVLFFWHWKRRSKKSARA
ncbi:MAG TPA: PEP-CTERM sorting domain-containing protein [Bryobacteraceae bacterium]